MTNNNDYLTLEQVADLLQVHYNTVYRWVALEKILPAIKVVRGWRVKRVDLDKFLENSNAK